MEFISTAQLTEAKPNMPLLQVMVLRAHNLPRFKTLLGKERQFYVTITYEERTWRTRSVRSVARHVEWNESVDPFAVKPHSRIAVSLYAEMATKKDILIGRQEIDCGPQRELVLSVTDGHIIHTEEPTTLSSTPTVSVNLTTVVTNLDPTAVNLPVEGRPVSDGRTEISRALYFTEEAVDAMKTWRSAVDVVKQVMDHVGPIVKLLPHATLAWELLSKIPETLLHQFRRDDNVRALLEAIRDAFEIAKEADILKDMEPASTQAKILDEMLECVSECSKFIISYAKDVEVGTRVLKNVVGQLDGKVERYRANLVRLRDNFLAHVAVLTKVAVLEAELDAKIRELPYKGGWRFGDEKRCLPGTREDFLDHIMKWVENPKSKRGLVLLGQAGTGKSSIANEVACRFKDKCLGSYFTFLRKEGSKDDAYQLFTTLARDLSDRHSAFKLALGKIIKDNSSLRGSRDYRTLFGRLLVEPLKDLSLPGLILVVIDALDESGDTIGKIGLHSFLAKHLVDLPSNFRVLITSRPEDGVELAFSKAPSVETLYMNDAKLASKTEQDIVIYLKEELPPDVFKDHGVKLAKASEGLFQWATVSCGFINSRASLGLSMKKRVERLLGHSRGRSGGLLDTLYEEILKEYFKTDEAQTLFRSIMGQLFAAIEPLSIESLIALRRYAPVDDPEDSDPVPVLDILRHLGPLLSNVTSSDQTRPIMPVHTSFRDFLTTRMNNVFYVDLEDAHHRLTHSCVGLMLDNLKFNICKLESSYLANSDVPDIDTRISKYIPPGLSYACVFWGNHLEHVAFEHGLFTKLKSLFERKFLFWLEVLSLLSKVRLALPALSSQSKWLQRERLQTEVIDLLALVHDAFTFVRYFGIVVVRSAPHIYISALPFAPSSSRILNHYSPQFPHTLSLECGQLPHWPALEMTIAAHDDDILSVAFSPDGQRIASASRDHTIRMWDAATGELVVGPFTGHTAWVFAVAFSPDGQRIASASHDCTIRVWDAATGEVIAGPFTGHTNSVKFVAFSLDGQRITSASLDRTICVWNSTTGDVVAGPFTRFTDPGSSDAISPDGQRIACTSDNNTFHIWDATTGKLVAGPFTGHTDWVYSVAFSPNGQHIASASSDHTIRVWDTETGEVVAGPFTGHTSSVNRVAFSPDGQRIASGSSDRTICVRDVATGVVVAGPFTGHTDSIGSVVFSPDGLRIASASLDRTIRVWDAEAVAKPFTGHTDCVSSVAFSPDGQRIASASDDHLIRVWDAATGELVLGPIVGHTSWVTSVAFSPNGQRIASASGDHTIRVWDAATGKVVFGPFTGHTSRVNNVAFSPDGRRIASASSDETIRVWGAATMEIVTHPFTGHGTHVIMPINSVAFSPDGQCIASASSDRTVRVWDATTGELIAGPFTGHTDSVLSVAFSPDGQSIASSSRDHTIRVWGAATGDISVGAFTGHTDLIKCVAFSPDGQYIASASYDHTIRMWDAATGKVIAGPFTGHISSVTSVAFSPDGRRIASASRDGVIRVEKVTTEDIGNFHFMNHSRSWLDSDGWICGKGGELLLWIPALHRACLHRPSTVWAIGQQETRLDFSKFVHGSNWATVYRDDNNLSK